MSATHPSSTTLASASTSEFRPRKATKRIRLKLPGTLKNAMRMANEFDFEGETIDDLIQAFDRAYPGFTGRISDEEGAIRPYIKIFVNGAAIVWERDRNALEMRDGDTFTLMLALAGG
jgi:sulfur-carrier protein